MITGRTSRSPTALRPSRASFPKATGPAGLFSPDVWLCSNARTPSAFHAAPNATRAAGSAASPACGRRHAARADADSPRSVRSCLCPPTRRPRAKARPFPDAWGHPEVQSLAPYADRDVGGRHRAAIACSTSPVCCCARHGAQREIAIRMALGPGACEDRPSARDRRGAPRDPQRRRGAGARVVERTLPGAFSLPAPIPQPLEMPIGIRFVLFTMLMVLVAGVRPPSCRRCRRRGGCRELDAPGRRRGSRPSRLRSVFVVVQIAGSTLFLATALLFVKSFWNANRIDLGFTTDHVVVARMDPSLYGFEGARAAWSRSRWRIAVVGTGTHGGPGGSRPLRGRLSTRETVSTSMFDCLAVASKPTLYHAVGARHFDAIGPPSGPGVISRRLSSIPAEPSSSTRRWPRACGRADRPSEKSCGSGPAAPAPRSSAWPAMPTWVTWVRRRSPCSTSRYATSIFATASRSWPEPSARTRWPPPRSGTPCTPSPPRCRSRR